MFQPHDILFNLMEHHITAFSKPHIYLLIDLYYIILSHLSMVFLGNMVDTCSDIFFHDHIQVHGLLQWALSLWSQECWKGLMSKVLP